ncbi:MAG TPA: ATP-binding cassette domain-containing protein [Streptosporangiaceae bacterium]|nr:ATP-binding cassette domain-containing protein [Streptosporangiaceae bacterium]
MQQDRGGRVTMAATPAAPATRPVVEAAGISKRFGSTQALRGVDLALAPGRCLGLVGRNGAGKSTLVSVLSGIYAADSGRVSFSGEPAPALGDVGGWRRRIATVHQHSMLVPALTVAENVFLGRQPGRGGALVDWRQMQDQAQALRGVDLALAPGRCLGPVGRNGAGKSTLVSVLSGIYAADAGRVSFSGEPAPALGDVGGWRRRIATVHQHSMVVPALTVAENVFLGRQPGRGGALVDWRQMHDQAQALMREWGFPIDVRLPCARLTVEQRQIVEIARAIAAGTRCLLLDEPTAALERDATARLFARVRQLTASGVAVLYISHHLEEVFEICQDVAVIRDGEIVLTAPAAQVSKEQLVAAMVGPAAGPEVTAAAVADSRRSGAEAAGGVARLTVDRVSAASLRGSLRDVSLEIAPGERVGVTGLLSAGVATLARVCAGAQPYEAGRVLIDGRPLAAGRPDLALLAGVGYIPEDRQAEGFVPQLGVAENATMTIVDRLAGRIGWLRPQARAAAAGPLTRRLSVVSAGLAQPVGELSGGNQQKVTVARALVRQPRLIVALTPTRGVDVAAKTLLLDELAEVTSESGASLLLATDELSDLVICDRVIVLVRGQRFAEFTRPPFDREALIAATEGLASWSGVWTISDRREDS